MKDKPSPQLSRHIFLLFKPFRSSQTIAGLWDVLVHRIGGDSGLGTNGLRLGEAKTPAGRPIPEVYIIFRINVSLG